MRVLQILPELNLGGVEKGTIELAKYLALNGHYPIVISNGGKLERDLQEFGVKHYKLPVNKKSLSTLLLLPKLIRIFNKEQVDIVHARSRVPALVAYLAFKRYFAGVNLTRLLTQVPSFITTAHGYYSNHAFSRIMAKGKIVISPSRVIAKHMIEDFNVPLERIRLIPRGVNLSDYEFILPTDKDWQHPVFAIIARLSPIKGHIEFIKAFREVLHFKPFAKAWIIGAPSPGKEGYLKELEVLIKRFGLENAVDFLGRRYDIPDLLKKINVVVQPSRIPESFGRVIIEAQAAGVPVVASSLGGYREIIEEDETGFLVPSRDPKLLAKCLIKIVKDPYVCDKMAKIARDRVESRYSLDKVNKDIVNVYKESGKRLVVLIIKFGALGDVILSIPGIKALRQKFPDAKLCLLTTAAVADIFKDCPYLDKLLIYSDRGFKYCGIFRSINSIRRINPDISIDLQNNKISRLIAFFSSIYQRYGFANAKFSFLLNRAQRLPNTPLLPVEHQSYLLSKLGVRGLNKELELWVDRDALERVDNFLRAHWISKKQPLVAINIAASSRWASKRWSLGKVIALIDELGSRNIRFVITGSPLDKDAALQIMKACKNKPIDAVGKTEIPSLIALIKRCSMLLTSDSAPLHIAAAVKTPVLGLFGPTDPLRHLPSGADVYFIKKELNCSPCYKNSCRKKVTCMSMITIEEVKNKILNILDMERDENSAA
ncbi:MAG: GT4 family glycosyltransferase PelF [Candidatus Kaelpia imicola]|nr:GT4 family glycosyltransferase PelF [Candidatus Kaelpia imicola]